MGEDTGVEQEIIVIGFAARNGIGRVRKPGRDSLLLSIANEIINPVFGPLIAHAAAEGKDVVNVIAVLQERREVGDAVTGVTPGGISGAVIHAAGGQGPCQIEEFLIGIEGLVIGIETPRQLPVIHQLTVEGNFGAKLVCVLLRCGETGDLTFAECRERIEFQRFVAVIDLADRVLAEKSASEYCRLIR